MCRFAVGDGGHGFRLSLKAASIVTVLKTAGGTIIQMQNISFQQNKETKK